MSVLVHQFPDGTCATPPHITNLTAIHPSACWPGDDEGTSVHVGCRAVAPGHPMQVIDDRQDISHPRRERPQPLWPNGLTDRQTETQRCWWPCERSLLPLICSIRKPGDSRVARSGCSLPLLGRKAPDLTPRW